MNRIQCAYCDDNTLETDVKPSYSAWARFDRYGIYAGCMCDDCYEHSDLANFKFDALDAGESLEEAV